MTLSLYNGADLASPLKRHLRDIVSVVNGLTIHRPVTLPSIDLSTGSPTEASFEIPNWANKITVPVSGVSLDGGTDSFTLRVGTGGTLSTSGYLGSATSLAGGASNQQNTDGFTLIGATAALVEHGIFTLYRIGKESNTWCCTALLGRSDNAQTFQIAGSIILAGPLDIVAFTRNGTTDAFDAGVVGCRYAR